MKPCFTAERNTTTWSPSRALQIRDGCKLRSRMLHLPTCGSGWPTVVHWISGIGSLMRLLTILTGRNLIGKMSVTWLEPWKEEVSRSGEDFQTLRGLIFCAPSKRRPQAGPNDMIVLTVYTVHVLVAILHSS